MTLLELFEDYDGDATSERRCALVEALQKADKILAGLDEGRSALLAEMMRKEGAE